MAFWYTASSLAGLYGTAGYTDHQNKIQGISLAFGETNQEGRFQEQIQSQGHSIVSARSAGSSIHAFFFPRISF